MCPQAGKRPSLQWYGYAVDGIGFHYLELDESLMVGDAAVKEREAMLIAAENRLNADLLTQDLKALVEDNWDWQVRRISDTDFVVIFPFKDSHILFKNLCRNFGGIVLPISKVSVCLLIPSLTSDPHRCYPRSGFTSPMFLHVCASPIF
jgi:hypothetical protein